MCSSHQKNQLIELGELKAISGKKYYCPNCGRQTMQVVSGSFTTDDGIIVDTLERFHCAACNSDFMNLSAMKKIREFREKKTQVAEAV